MKKLCIVKYDELEKPIELVEVKEFTNVKVLEDFKHQCAINKQEHEQRLAEKQENERKEKQRVDDEIETLQKEKESLKLVISHILGYRELNEKEIKKVLGEEEHE